MSGSIQPNRSSMSMFVINEFNPFDTALLLFVLSVGSVVTTNIKIYMRTISSCVNIHSDILNARNRRSTSMRVVNECNAQ